MPDAAALHALTELAADTPTWARVAIGGLGVVVALFGARLYHRALGVGAFVVGAAVGGVVPMLLAALAPPLANPVVVAIGALVGAVALLVVARAAHRVLVIGLGGVVGAAAGGAVAAATAAAAWWAPLLGAAIGAIAMPFLFDLVLKLTTPAVGALLVAWAAGRPDAAWLLVGVWAVGALVQLAAGRRRDDDEEDA